MEKLKPPVIIVPAAGHSGKMSIGKPKLCLSFDDGPLWSKQVKCFKEALPNSPVYYIVGFGSQHLQGLESQVNLIANEHYDKSNVGYSVSLGIEESGDKDILVVNGDLYFENRFIQNIAGSGYNNYVVRDKGKHINDSEIGIVDNDSRLTNFNYSSPNKWSQILYLKNNAKWQFYEIAQKHPNYYTFEVVNLLTKDFRFDVIDGPANSFYAEIDTNKDFLRARKIIAHQEALKMWDCY